MWHVVVLVWFCFLIFYRVWFRSFFFSLLSTYGCSTLFHFIPYKKYIKCIWCVYNSNKTQFGCFGMFIIQGAIWLKWLDTQSVWHKILDLGKKCFLFFFGAICHRSSLVFIFIIIYNNKVWFLGKEKWKREKKKRNVEAN